MITIAANLGKEKAMGGQFSPDRVIYPYQPVTTLLRANERRKVKL
jgi:hypothetical protein